METAVDFLGGMTWVVMGTSQLMSVPYALYAKTSGNGAGPQGPAGPAGADGTNGTDGLAGADGATGPQGPAGPAGADGTNGTDGLAGADGATGPQGPIGNDGPIGATGPQGPIGNDGAVGSQGAQGIQGPAGNDGVGIAQTLSKVGGTITLSDGGGSVNIDDTDATNELQQLTVSTTGDTLHLQNGGYVIIPGISAANASGGGGGTYPTGSVFCNGSPTTIVDVTNPTTGAIWMDRNLGATQAATSSTDVDAYGDLYQWGRRSDGHQCRTGVSLTSTLSPYDQPGTSDFILNDIGLTYDDWRSPQNDNLWQGLNGINNPCPSGYRLPTEAELNAERASWSSTTIAGALASPLKFSIAGYRHWGTGVKTLVGAYGLYWSSTFSGTNARILNIDNLANLYFSHRARGATIRCIKD